MTANACVSRERERERERELYFKPKKYSIIKQYYKNK